MIEEAPHAAVGGGVAFVGIARGPQAQPCLARAGGQVDQLARLFQLADCQVGAQAEDFQAQCLAVTVNVLHRLRGRGDGAEVVVARVPRLPVVERPGVRYAPFDARVALLRQMLGQRFRGEARQRGAGRAEAWLEG